MFQGAMVALVTPFKEGKIDESNLKELINFQIEGGIDAIVPCGTTGESATLSHEEHKRVMKITVEAVNGRIPVLAGTGSNNTMEAIRLTGYAKEAGADGALLITPYYNKPNKEGVYQHYRKVALEVDIPIVLYNVPGRTALNLDPETVARLAEIPNIVGIKEASGSLQQISEIINLCKENFSVISGDDFITLPVLAIGGKGVISVTANLVPGDVSRLYDSFEKGDYDRARKLHYKLLPLNNAMFLETNPIPVKTALSLLGRISPEMRLPLGPMSDTSLKRLQKVMKEYGLI